MNIKSYLLFLAITIITISQACKPKESKEPGNVEVDNYYTEKFRPQIHFSPEANWMNDPNGMVYYEGEYHLFYQYYPDSTVWGPMHWGHAVSKNLVHWEHLPIALYPDSLGFVFSGSCVIDRNNTSGFGTKEQPAMVAIYTHAVYDELKVPQKQGIAYSTDKGRTWTTYEGNPVLNEDLRAFRDPKVFWYEETGVWIMSIAATTDNVGIRPDHIRFYSSPDLKNWTYLSDFGHDVGSQEGKWECPDLFKLPVEGTNEEKWVLIVSVDRGGVNGGSSTQYFVGNFDGKKFTTESNGVNWVDCGKDNYAGVTWSDVPKEDGRRLFIGWMSNWLYATSVPTVKWRSAMTVPRELKLIKVEDEVKLTSVPVKELHSLRGEKTNIELKVVSGEVDITTSSELLPCEVILEFDSEKDSQFGNASEYGIELENVSGENIKVGYNPSFGEIFIDRTKSGFDDFSKEFPGMHIAKYKSHKPIKLHFIIDVASIEVFVNDGEAVMTDIFFPSENYSKMKLFAKNGQVKLNQGAVYKLNSIWRKQ